MRNTKTDPAWRFVVGIIAVAVLALGAARYMAHSTDIRSNLDTLQVLEGLYLPE